MFITLYFEKPTNKIHSLPLEISRDKRQTIADILYREFFYLCESCLGKNFYLHNLKILSRQDYKKIPVVKHIATFQVTFRMSLFSSLHYKLFKKFPQKTIKNLYRLLTKLKTDAMLDILPIVTIKNNQQNNSKIEASLTKLVSDVCTKQTSNM